VSDGSDENVIPFRTSEREAYTVRYFGAYWDVPALEAAVKVPTPVGVPCLYCEEAIRDGQRGYLRGAFTPNGPQMLPAHRECDFRAVMGSIGHLLRRCSCFGGDFEDLPELSAYDNARLVWAWFHVYGIDA
jgi:hypothetical protein